MPQSPRQSGDDERIDKYVCGRLSPQDELEFEAEFIGNPVLVKKIEEAYALKQCLGEAKKQGGFKQSEMHSPLQKWWNFFAVPQTAWGAVAASLLLVPVFLGQLQGHPSEGVNLTSVYLLGEESLRGGSAQEKPVYEIDLQSSQSQVVLGFVVPPSAGEPLAWDIEILDKDNHRVWFGEHLYGNSQSVVYVVVGNEVIKEGAYTYKISTDAEGNVINSGIINVRGNGK